MSLGSLQAEKATSILPQKCRKLQTMVRLACTCSKLMFKTYVFVISFTRVETGEGGNGEKFVLPFSYFYEGGRGGVKLHSATAYSLLEEAAVHCPARRVPRKRCEDSRGSVKYRDSTQTCSHKTPTRVMYC